MTVLGIDIGGTKIAAGLVEQGRVIERTELPTRAAEGYAISRSQVNAAIDRLLRPSITAIGICAPGPLNPLTGVVLNPPNLPGWVDVPLADQIANTYGLPCLVENDANAAGLAEAVAGAAKGFRHVFYATISTGIGTGIIIDGRVYHGRNGAAAEGGHVSLNPTSGVLCNCGRLGCIEALASGTAIAYRARELRQMASRSILEESITAQSVAAAAEAGDPCAKQAVREAVQYLAQWLGGIVTLLDPDIVVLGGGVSNMGEALLIPLRAQMPLFTINPHAKTIPIVQSALGLDAGIVGAATVVSG